MADSLANDRTGTFSRLIPASRSLTYPPLGQLRNRKAPAPCLGASDSSQSSGSPGQYQTGDFYNEMRTVESTYTACVRSEDLPLNTQELYRLVARLAGLAANGSDEHPFTPTEASNAVRCLDQYVRETASETNVANSEISRMATDTRLFRFHGALGDFFAFICTNLRAGKNSLISKQPWTLIVPALDKEEEDRIAWEASDQTSNRPFGRFTEALWDRVNDLQVAGWDDLDLEITLLAVRSYARRNFLCHSKVYDLGASKNFRALGQYLEEVDKQLEAVLPDEEKPLADKYRRIVAVYRDQHIRKENGEWKDAKSLAGKTAGSSPLSNRPSRSTVRLSMDIGQFRPPGLAGPPPSNVSYDSTAFRRHTVDEPRGTKRTAVGQPLDEPRRKRVALSDNFVDTRTEPKQDAISDKTELEIAKSLKAVHAIFDEWRQLDSKKYLTMLIGQQASLTQRLSEVKAGMAKTKRVELPIRTGR